MNNALIHVNEIQQEEVLRLTLRPNPYYSSPKCVILETGKGFSHFGVREEYDLASFQKSQDCQVYLARPGIGQQSVQLHVMVVTNVVSGLSSECQPQVSVRVALTVNFCAEEWSCDEDIRVEDGTNTDYDAEYVTNCDSEWGCEPADGASNDCPGEWGCVPIATDTTTYSPELGSRNVIEDTTGETVENVTDKYNNDDEDDVVAVIYNTLMSETMTPVTITVLILVGILLLLAMWCLMCRRKCARLKQPERSLSMASTLTTVNSDRRIIGPMSFSRENSVISRNNSSRSSARSESLPGIVMNPKSDAKDDKDKNEKEFTQKDPAVTGRRDLFTVSEETNNFQNKIKKKLEKVKDHDHDPTEDGLESLEWCNSKPKIIHKRNTSTVIDTFEDNNHNVDETEDYPTPTIKLPAVVANSYRKAQKDIPVTFYY